MYKDSVIKYLCYLYLNYSKMTEAQLDPELELEAQQLSNYEDEQRMLAEEAEQCALEDAIWEAEMDRYHEEIER
jgi:hypothetical protein